MKLTSRRHLQGWPKVYGLGAETALYLSVFVTVAQAFLKTSELNALAPTRTEPPLKFTQLAILVRLIVLGTVATVRTRTPATQTVLSLS